MSVTTILPINSLHASDNYGIGSSRDMGYGNIRCTFSTFGTAEKDTYGTAEKDTYGSAEKDTFGK